MASEFPKLQTFLAHAGVASRRKSEEFIREGSVVVNGQTATIGMRVDPQKDVIEVNGEKIGQPEMKIVYLIYKPVGILSTTSDELGRRNVIDFLRSQLPKGTKLPRLYPVGRLDQDSEGLMILTNDGDLAQKMSHPSFETPKTYRITVDGMPTELALAHLERGVLLREGKTSPAEVNVIDTNPHESILEITIHEGWNHQVKRMLQRVGYEVTKLTRIQMGEYTLEDLEGAKWKEVPAGGFSRIEEGDHTLSELPADNSTDAE